MQTILLDGRQYSDGHALHQALKRLLALPDYYGMNADALYDCLTERRKPVRIWVAARGDGDVGKAMVVCLRVFEDAGCSVREL